MNDKFAFDILTHPSDYRETAKIIYGTRNPVPVAGFVHIFVRSHVGIYAVHSAFGVASVLQISVYGVKMLGEIKELNDECLFVKGRNSKNAILKNFLGRYQLLDFNMIRPLSELLKFEGAEDKSQIDEVINKIITVYGYLQNGSDPE